MWRSGRALARAQTRRWRPQQRRLSSSSSSAQSTCDVLVVGAGNAAMCAALSAREAGASVIMLERANEAEAGGNTRYTAGAMRFAHAGADDVATLVDLSAEELDLCDFGEYTEEQFTDDMLRNPPLTSSPHRPRPGAA